MKFAICNETYQKWKFEEVCADVAKAGYDGLEIAPFTLHEDPAQVGEARAKELKKIAADAGLQIIGLHWLLASPAGLHITTDDAGVRLRTTGFLQHLARLCAAMGGQVMVFGSPKQRDIPDGVWYDEACKRAVEVFRGVCEVAQPLGVTLALEPLGPIESNFLQTTDETVRVMRMVDHPACQLHLDVKAMCSAGEPVAETITQHAGLFPSFHANDSNRRGPGFGEIDFVPIARALKAAKYDRYVSVEVFDYRPDPQTIARQSLEYLKRTFREAGAI